MAAGAHRYDQREHEGVDGDEQDRLEDGPDGAKDGSGEPRGKIALDELTKEMDVDGGWFPAAELDSPGTCNWQRYYCLMA